MIDKALFSLRPNSQWMLRGDTYEGIEWLDEPQIKPTKEEILNEVVRLQAEYDSTEYQRKRQLKYPPITDQLDMLWHMMDDETIPGKNSTWYNTIKEVKDNNPK
jgi:hypothetical protein